MSSINRRRPAALCATRNTVQKLNLEHLEERRVLSANPLLPPATELQVDPTDYEDGSLLVRFQGNTSFALEQVDGHLQKTAGRAGSAAGLRHLADGWHSVDLPSGVAMQDALTAYQADPNVLYAEPNYVLRIAQLPDDARFDEMWPLENTGQTLGTPDADIDADWAWDVTTGSGNTIVAVIDTGVDYNHPDLAPNMWVNSGEIPGDGIDNDGNQYVDDVYGYDFINADGDPMDDQGHGTHVAGTIGAAGNNGIGITGINWSVQIMALKFLGADGSGTTEDAIESIYYARDNGADVINASWGGDPFSQALFDAISATADADQIFVAASGNGDAFGIGIDNDANPFYPSGYEVANLIAVAASDHNDNLGTFSNYGATTVDIAAPGVNILSTTVGGGYGLNSGTSMAAPHVSGVAALVRDLNPQWDAVQVIQQMMDTADPKPSLQGLLVSGGRLNVAAAVGNPTPPPAPPPPATLPMFEDFVDSQISFEPQSGNWMVASQRYTTTPAVENPDFVSVSKLNLSNPLPADVEIRAIMQADPGFQSVIGIVISDHLTNSFLVYDFVDADNFKFAGADMDADAWMIGRREQGVWTVDTQTSATLEPNTPYDVRLRIENGNQVTLVADGVEQLTWQHAGVVTGGTVGVASKDSTSHFDDILVQPYVAPIAAALPVSDDFEDGLAEHFESQLGLWFVDAGRYEAVPGANLDAFSSFQLTDPLPSDVEILTTIHASDVSLGRLSNAFVIYDYQSPTDFKFAGAYAGVDRWIMGHRTATDWIEDAAVIAQIDADTYYDLHVRLTNQTATLMVNGVTQLSYTFSDPLNDGQAGLGTKNALARFDNVQIREFTPPQPPSSTTLPLTEDFNDGVADYFQAQAGSWSVNAGRYRVAPVLDQDGISTLQIEAPLPSGLEISATINADDLSLNRFSNGFIIYDYQGPTDFKFAGAYVASNLWLIGHRTAAGWIEDATFSESISPWTDYAVHVVLDGNTATLSANGVTKLSHTFADPLTDGPVGVGTRDAFAEFDDIRVQEYIPPAPPPSTSLPVSEDFNDDLADFFEVRDGTWTIEAGRYRVVPVLDQDGVSTLRIEEPLPSQLTIQATVNADDVTPNRFSNAFTIFDYQSPTNFKFAGGYMASDQWLIGRRDVTGWVTDVSLTEPLLAAWDYDLEVQLEDDKVTLIVDGVTKISHTYSGDLLTDGDVGVGTRDALSYFDNVQVQQYVPPPPLPGTTLPVTEDFDDGVADFFEVRSGVWSVPSGRYRSTPAVDEDGVSTLRVDDPLPSSLEILATINADDVTFGRLSNAMVIFDYQDPLDFKFAGAYAGADRWLIGQRTALGWLEYATVNAPINAWNDYDLRVVLENNSASLFVNGDATLSHTFADSLSDGDVGVGTRNAFANFDDIQVRPYQPPASASLPFTEDFNDGTADFFDVMAGDWTLQADRYRVVPVLDQDGVSTLRLTEPLPVDLEISATINADDVTFGRFSNGFIIYDYQGPTNFKFAGSYVASNLWLIGRRTSFGWVTDASITESILPFTDYDVSVVLESNQVRLLVGGSQKLTFQYADLLTDGSLGIGTRDALATFDNVQVQDLTTQTQSVAGIHHVSDDSTGETEDDTTGAVANNAMGLLQAVRNTSSQAAPRAQARHEELLWLAAAEELFSDYDEDELAKELLDDLLSS